MRLPKMRLFLVPTRRVVIERIRELKHKEYEFSRNIKGVIKKVDLMYKTPEEYAKDLLNGLGKDKLPSCHKSWVEYLCIELYGEYFYANGQLFKLVKSSEIGDTDYCHIEDNKDGTYSFVTSFYNGCTCLKEMLEDELKRIL